DPGPDFVVTDAQAPDTGVLGTSVTVNWTVANQGLADPPVSSFWYDAIYLSDDQVLDANDTFLADTSTSELAVNASTDPSLDVYLSGGVGLRYLLIVTDAYDYQSETNEDNNVVFVPITLQAADLVVHDASATFIPGSGGGGGGEESASFFGDDNRADVTWTVL